MTGRTRFEPLSSDDLSGVAGYPFRARIGDGGAYRTYLSLTPDGRPVAVKVVRPDYAADAEFRRRFAADAGAARNVDSRHVAAVVDANPSAETPWIATTYVPGPNLAEAVQLRGPLPEGIVLGLLAGVAEALKAIHAAGLAHRRLKPANVLLAADGPRVVDFGLPLPTGSPAFLAPEQIRGEDAGPAADVFALGGLCYFAATGRTAFGEGPDAAYRITDGTADLAGCPERLLTIVQRCLEKVPAARPTLDELLADTRDAGSWLPAGVFATFTGYDVAAVPGMVPPPPIPQPAAPMAGTVPVPPPPAPWTTAVLPVPVLAPAPVPPPAPAARQRSASGRGAVIIAVTAVLVVAATTFAVTKPWQTTKSGLSGKMLSAPPRSTSKPAPTPAPTGPSAGPTSSVPPPIVLPSPPAPVIVPSTSLSPSYDFLDDAVTDTTPQTADAMLPSTYTDSSGRIYNLESSDTEACVNQYESTTAQNVLSSNSCSSDIVGSYIYAGGSILVSVSVLTFPDANTATSVEKQLASSTNTGDLGWHCPDTGTGSSVCADGVSGDALQDGWVSNVHRYVLSADAIFIDQATSSQQEDALKTGARGAVDLIGPLNYYK